MANWRIDEASLEAFRTAVEGHDASDAWFALRRATERLALRPSFDRLITLDDNTIKELPHQIRVAEQVLRTPMLGRAILADEVGLGKTIEAGIILKELKVRGLARTVLILTPAALVDQWVGELEDKFFEIFDRPEAPDDWADVTRAVVSLSRARQPKHTEAILRRRWDLVIVDEAHKIKNHKTAGYRLVSEIERNYLLLLTATPLQNHLRELYNLVDLLRPGQLGTWRQFAETNLERGDTRRPRDPEVIKDLTARVLVRTRRANVADSIRLPRRTPVHPVVELTDEEAALYRDTLAFVRDLYRRGFREPSVSTQRADTRRRKRTGKGIHALDRIRLCRRLCSSSHALASSLKSLADGEWILPDYRRRATQLQRAAEAVDRHAKLTLLQEVLGEASDRVVVFSEHHPTLRLLERSIRASGRHPVMFHGKMSRRNRAKSLATFRSDPRSVFVATKAGTEGLNLQFCNKLVNYDLPWNPMVIEQRIGRVHRIGQEREVFIINLAARGTVEQRVLELLDQKIRLFELVVGELDVILGEFGGSESLEHQLVDALLDADSDAQFDRAVAGLGDALEQSRTAGIEQERLNSEVMAEDTAMRLEREFTALTVPARLRLAYGTKQLVVTRAADARRHELGIHVSEILDMLGSMPVVQDAEIHPEYGPLQDVIGLTGRAREVTLVVQAHRLPMVLVDVSGDPEPALQLQ